MEFEERNDRNERPKEATKNFPMMVLLVLVGIICALLFIGWKYMADDTAGNEELTPAPADSVSKVKPPKNDGDNVATATKLAEKPKTENVSSTPTEALPAISMPKLGDKKAVADNKKPAATSVEATAPAEKPKTEIATIPAGGEVISHTVGENETFNGIANRYNMKIETLKKMNPDVDPNNGLKVGATKLKIRVKATHTVGPGDVLRVVSTKYHVSIPLIMEANKKTKNYAERGEELIIPFATKQ